MEIVPGIHRLESYIGDKLMAHHLITDERSLLVDTGTPELARQELVPWLADVLGDPARLAMILVTHADVDHFGGLAVIREACPRAVIVGPRRDRRWIEETEAIFAERYDAYHADHGLTYEPSITAMLHAWHGPPVPVDVGLVGGEDLRIGSASILEVLHVPGHSPGHLMLWDAVRRVALIGDALNGATQIDRHGAWTAPPPYTDRDGYLMAIQTVQALDPAVLLAGHYPVMRGPEIGAFVDASRDFVHRVDRVLERLLADGEPLTLAAAIERANPLLGPFGFPPDLSFALATHLDWLERRGRVQRRRREGVVAWQAL